jgi:hypothetical protein
MRQLIVGNLNSNNANFHLLVIALEERERPLQQILYSGRQTSATNQRQITYPLPQVHVSISITIQLKPGRSAVAI